MAKLEIGNQSSMHELISNVEARAEIDLHGAIALLKQTSLSPAFLPWGSFALIKLLRRAGLKDEWRSYCTSLFVSHPEFFTVWQHRLDCCLSVAEYLGVATQIFFQIKTDLPQVPWLRPTLIETLLAVGQGDLEYFLQGATSAGVIERRLVDRIFALMPILVEIRLADQAVSKGARAWRYSFCGRDCPVLVRVDDLVHVNLSHLRLGGIDQGEKVLAPVFHRVCHRLLNEIPYDDDTGLGSFPKIGRAHV